MRILYFTHPCEDYLADGLLLGLREILGEELIDFPKAEILYGPKNNTLVSQVRGSGFTLYDGILEDIQVDRYDVFSKVKKKYYDFVIFSNIWRQYAYFWLLYDFLNPQTTIFVDGEDGERLYPNSGEFVRKLRNWSAPSIFDQGKYFKREWTHRSFESPWLPFGSSLIWNLLRRRPRLFRISFSIPMKMIVETHTRKLKDFPIHIVDSDLAAKISNASIHHVFTDQDDYYSDLRSSRFGVTVKRSGWDCLRHYEIAACGAVPCFRDLHLKPATCAPHGLDTTNCIVYRSSGELFSRIEALSESDYEKLREKSIQWAKGNSTIECAKKFLSNIESS